jgi:hypothetical protein
MQGICLWQLNSMAFKAIPAAQRSQLEELKSEDPFDPAPQDRKTPGKVTVSEDTNEDDLKAKRQGKKVAQGLSTTKTRGVQMSHQWGEYFEWRKQGLICKPQSKIAPRYHIIQKSLNYGG